MRQQRRQLRSLEPALLELRLGLGLVLALHERFRLREEVGEQDGVMLADWILRDDGCDEVGGDQLGALVHQLVEGVLTVGARLAPNDRAGRCGHGRAVALYALAVRLHVALLEVGGEAVHVLVVRQDSVRLGAVKVPVPNAEHRQHHGQVGRERRGGEVLVHGVRSAHEGGEVVPPDGESNRRADRRPRRVAATHPVPEAEHVLGVDAKLGHGLAVGRERRKVAPHPRGLL
mmetsp:Transcript_3253/g.8600  ORF Transcript_3253/g.8600 Transcript_3253/m.8600 type:complete len:231 (-) Transcript_3253:7-699(-)